MLIVTTDTLPGYTIESILGTVYGITVRSRSSIAASFARGEASWGGRVSLYVTLAAKAYQEANELMAKEAQRLGANAILAVRFDSSEIEPGIVEVLAYGTAVVAKQDKRSSNEPGRNRPLRSRGPI
jgi:uncharacterized protein YbjQ (UPF0145 family)